MADAEADLGSETNTVHRRGDIVLRSARPHSPSVHALLRHLETCQFDGAPRVVGSGMDPRGREMLTYIAGEFAHPCQSSAEATFALGSLLRRLHRATATFAPAADARWRPWFIRELGDGPRVISHCDAAPWNVCLRGGQPVALIDWDLAGPVDPLVELAHAAWLNCGLYSDDIPERDALPPIAERAGMLKAIVEGYKLPAPRRRDVVSTIVVVAIHATAATADEHGVTHETRESPALWGMAWQARSAAWVLRNQATLERALA